MWSFSVVATEITQNILNQMYDYYNSRCGNKEDLDAGHILGIMEMKWVVQYDAVETGLWARNKKVIQSPAWHLWPEYIIPPL